MDQEMKRFHITDMKNFSRNVLVVSHMCSTDNSQDTF